MRSYPQCISPLLLPLPGTPSNPPWKELAAFRETALRHFTRPEDRAAVEHLGSLLFESALEQAHLWPPIHGSETASAAEAGRLDLLHTLRFFHHVGQARFQSTLPPHENALAAILARTAERMLPEVERLRHDLERYRQAADRVN
jgi:hypothetical protein